MTKFLKKFYTSLLNPKSAALIFGLAFLIVAVPNQAGAVNPAGVVTNFIGGLTSYAIAGPILILNYIISLIVGVAVSIISYFISVVLQLNTNIAASSMVKSGFAVTLSLANLGFVLSIIIIAIATILRYETYALKQTLWKLVAAAILVNFSLVIGGAILNFSDRLSLYFLESINPAGGGSSFENFAGTLSGAFGPQRIFVLPNTSSTADAALMGGGQIFGSAISRILNAFFPTLFLIVAVIALSGLFVMLLIRYIYLGILLIIMPMVWLLWIFPATAGQWQKWWNKFIQWTMFSPIALFFIWLALLTLGGNDPNNIQGIVFNSSSNSFAASISLVAGNTLSNMLGSLLQMAMMIAMLFVGLFMAQSMGITFASTTIKGASAVTSGFGKWSGRVGTRVGTAPLRTQAVRKAAGVLQQTRIGAGGGRLARTAGAVANYGLGWVGRGAENLAVAGGEKLTSEYAEEVKNLTKDQAVHQLSTSNAPRRIALLEKIKNEKWHMDPKVAGEIERYVGDDRKDEFGRYGKGKLYEDTRNETGAELRKRINEGATPEQIADYFKGLAGPGALGSIYFQKVKGVDGKFDESKVPAGMKEEEFNKMRETIIKGTAAGFAPNNLSEFYKTLAKGNQLDEFRNTAQELGMTEANFSKENWKFLEKNAARATGVGIELYVAGYKEKSEKETGENKENEEAKQKTGKYSTF